MEIGCIDLFGQPPIECCKDRFTDGCSVLQDIMAPEAENGTAGRAHEFVAAAVICAVGVLRTVDFDDELRFSAAEVGEVGADGELTGEFVTAQLTALEFKPKQSLGLIISLPQISRAFGRAGFSAAATI